ncbi:MAG: hypothetical protein GY749_29680 [Desulfobacteraceae bacterium]|nr:hypothetical protein [Desulfobacteraceae bacterium]
MSKIDKPFIEGKVKDWKQRLDSLYSLVEKSLTGMQNVECRQTKHMTMYEELMQKFEISPEKIPILDVYKDKNVIATFKPVGLWVIGANGRIDILTKSGAFILVDKAENGENSEWKVFSPKNRKKEEDFDPVFITELVSNQ